MVHRDCEHLVKPFALLSDVAAPDVSEEGRPSPARRLFIIAETNATWSTVSIARERDKSHVAPWAPHVALQLAPTGLLYQPTKLHEEARAPAAAHSVHSDRPLTTAADPMAQSSHAVAPGELRNVPASHSTHGAVRPTLEEYFPTPQAAHARATVCWFAAIPTVPMGHGTQIPVSELPNLPRGQVAIDGLVHVEPMRFDVDSQKQTVNPVFPTEEKEDLQSITRPAATATPSGGPHTLSYPFARYPGLGHE